MSEGLHADATTMLQRWAATSPEADGARRRTLALLRNGVSALHRTHRAGHVTASTMIIDSTGRLLLCLHGRLGLWMQVGGHCEPADASLAAAALREAREESGIAGLVLLPDPIDVDVHRVRCRPAEAAAASETFHFDVRFAALAPVGAAERASEESRALGWFGADALPAPLADGVRAQISPAFAALGIRQRSPGASGPERHEQDRRDGE